MQLRVPPSPGSWTWEQILLILGPVAASIVLIALYAAGNLPLGWPALLILVVGLNLAGDVVFAIRNERKLARGGEALCNDLVGSRAVAEEAFTPSGRRYTGAVTLAGERWYAASDRPVYPEDPLTVTGRRGLVLDVDRDPR